VAELNEFQVHGKQAQEKTLNEVSAEYERQLVAERNRRVEDLADAHQKFTAEASETARKHSEERSALQKRLDELEEENHSLRDQRYQLDSQVSQLSAQYGSASGELKALREECARLKEANLGLHGEKHELERHLNEVQVELAGLKSQVNDKESIISAKAERLAELEKTKGLLEVALEEYREQHRSAEQRFREQKAETEKGIQIIERFKNEISSSKSKIKTYKTMLQNQENQKVAVESEHERVKLELERTKQEVESRQQELESAKVAPQARIDKSRPEALPFRARKEREGPGGVGEVCRSQGPAAKKRLPCRAPSRTRRRS